MPGRRHLTLQFLKRDCPRTLEDIHGLDGEEQLDWLSASVVVRHVSLDWDSEPYAVSEAIELVCAEIPDHRLARVTDALGRPVVWSQ